MGKIGGAKLTREAFETGEVALDGTNPTPVVTGFDVITSVTITQKLAVAPGLGASVFTYDAVGGTVNIYAWQPTGAGDTTLVASTDTDTVAYLITGYKTL
jgi:hypothetical protein